MGQCAAMDRAAICECGLSADGGSAPPLRRAKTFDVGGTLGRSLRAFREGATAASRAAGLDSAEPLLHAASDLVESILKGVHQHLPDMIVDIELGAATDSELASISLEFAEGPLIGEFATRSRQPAELCLHTRVTFAIRRPSTDDFTSEPLVLAVSGLELHALPEIAQLRERLRTELLSWPDGWHPKSAGSWWLQNCKAEFAPEVSKLRRVCDSFSEVANLPLYFQGMAFWGYLHCCSDVFDSFDFYAEGSEVTVTAQARPLNPEDEDLLAVGRSLCNEMLQVYRPLAERFAASTVNMGAMFEGRALGQKGANPAKIAKLFSAAKTWGPGEDTWHQLDDTWLCVDKKDRWGRTVEEQGRIVWRAPGVPRPGDGRTWTRPEPLAQEAAPVVVKQGSARQGCSGVAMMALGLVLLLPSVMAHAGAATMDLGLLP